MYQLIVQHSINDTECFENQFDLFRIIYKHTKAKYIHCESRIEL